MNTELQLRYYQIDSIKAVEDNAAKGITSQLVILPTGAGKTTTMAKLYTTLHQKRLLFLAHTSVLLDQAKEEFKNICPQVPMYIERGDKKDLLRHNSIQYMQSLLKEVEPLEQPAFIVFATIQTMIRAIKTSSRFPKDSFDVCFIDESHRSLAASYRVILKHFGFNKGNKTGKLLLGVTATPERGDKRPLALLYETAAYSLDVQTLIEQKYLVPIKCFQIKTLVDLDNITPSSNSGDWDPNKLAKVIDTPARNQAIVEAYRQYGEGTKTLVFSATIKHADNICESFKQQGYKAKVIHGASSNKKETLAWFKSTSDAVLVNCMMLTEGFNEPSIKTIIISRPTLSRPLYQQMIGRGLRRFPNKTHATILDMVDVSKKFTLTLALALFGLPGYFQINGQDIIEISKQYKELSAELEKLKAEKRAERVKTIEEMQKLVAQITLEKVIGYEIDPFTSVRVGYYGTIIEPKPIEPIYIEDTELKYSISRTKDMLALEHPEVTVMCGRGAFNTYLVMATVKNEQVAFNEFTTQKEAMRYLNTVKDLDALVPYKALVEEFLEKVQA